MMEKKKKNGQLNFSLIHKTKEKKNPSSLLLATNDDTVYSMKAYTLAYNTIIIRRPTYDHCFSTHI